MELNAAFDHIAHNYDNAFTHTPVGKAQRSLVWKYFEKIQASKSKLKILELNCGTGEDAIWLAKKGHQVWATDMSEMMVNLTKDKVVQSNFREEVVVQMADIKKINEVFQNAEFDLVFSNFGGFNCLSPQEMIFFFESQLPQLLHVNGKFIGVIMTRFSLFESAYFLIKLRLKDVFRRLPKKGIEAKLNSNIGVKTWYYLPSDIQKILPKNLKITHQQAIGFFLPPSYLNSFFVNRPMLLKYLEKLEQRAIKIPFFANMSDHFLIEITKDSFEK